MSEILPPVLHLYLNFYEYEMLIERGLFLDFVMSSLFEVAGSLQSKQKAALSEQQQGYIIPHERSNSTQNFTTSTR